MEPVGSGRGLRNTGENWRTPAERSDYLTTPAYAETVEYLERIAAAHPDTVRIEDFGKTGEGRDLKLVIASKDGVFEPKKIHDSGRAILLVQNSIHAGEMDGKDACLALLRDMVRDRNRARLLERVVFVFIPVYNIDGHERRSAYNRINQNGPEFAGWRANASNLNLNRDFMKADAPETRAFLRMFHRWLPDFFVDNHVTDGADFQYDVTFALDATPDVHPATAEWILRTVTPELERRVNASGHLAFPAAIFLKDNTDPAKGLGFNENPPRFSTGQMILENRPGLLVELHMLKDYKTRVTGNYEIMVALLEVMNRDASELIALNRDADAEAARFGTEQARRTPFPLVISGNGETAPVAFRGYEFTQFQSEISGATAVRYGPEVWNVSLPMETGVTIASAVKLPAGYIIPPQWTHVIDVLDAHGVTFQRTSTVWTGRVECYRCSGMRWASRPFEGHFPILRAGSVEHEFGHFGECALRLESLTFPENSAVIRLDQRLSRVAVHWLEPEAPDSALRWGFFDPIFEQKETGEGYVLEKLAREEISKDSSLDAEFKRRIQTDPAFSGNVEARLGFFYDRSPWGLANRVGEYPVGRLLSVDGLPLS